MGVVLNSYRVRVRNKTYLWGNPQIPKAFGDVDTVFLTIRNDELGEPVSVKTEWIKIGGGGVKEDASDLGRIMRGQAYTLKLNDLTGVYATQDDGRPTFVTCTIHSLG